MRVGAQHKVWSLGEAEAYCRAQSRHYENFTVGSLLFPRKMRVDLAVFYAFCRGADDIGDEGDTLTEEGRVDASSRLEEWEIELEKCYSSVPRQPVFLALQGTIKRYNLPPEPFRDLISAFKQDQVKQRYRTFDELLDYCRRSANPVGRIYLMMFGYREAEMFALADKTCAALQLVNFLQDVRRDLEKGRIYLPQEDMERFDYSEADLKRGVFNKNFSGLMEFEAARAWGLFKEGLELERLVPMRLALELRLFRQGGEAILRKISALGYNVLKTRPALYSVDKAKILITSIISLRMGFGGKT